MSAWNIEPDFCLAVDYDLPEYDAAYVNKTRFLLIAALVISLLIHALVLALKPYFVSHSESPLISNLSVAIELLPAIQDLSQEKSLEKSIENMPELQEKKQQEKKQEIHSSELRPKVITEINNKDTNTQVIDKSIEWLTTEDYQAITDSKNKKFDTDDALAFNPGLKESRNQTRRVSRNPENASLETWKDGHGNQFYKTGDSCFMSLPQANNASNRDGVNWYRVSCGGGSGGGDMLDNVNREMRERFKNP